MVADIDTKQGEENRQSKTDDEPTPREVLGNHGKGHDRHDMYHPDSQDNRDVEALKPTNKTAVHSASFQKDKELLSEV